MKIDTADLVSPAEAKEKYKMSSQLLYDLRKRGKIKGIRLGWTWYYPRQELLDYLKNREKKFASRPLPDPK